MAKHETHNVLIGVTGSVATIKIIPLIEELTSRYYSSEGARTLNIRVIQTEHSKHFVSKQCLVEHFKANQRVEILEDRDEWDSWKKMSDPVLHVELRNWAHILLIAPLSANTMAKLANGTCDNLLTCVVRAWDMSKDLIYCPAMNTHMYNHPITGTQLSQLDCFGYLRVDSIEKRLACGDFGIGAMASVDKIAEKAIESLRKM